MPYFRVDDRFPDHHKIAGLTDAAFRLHVAGIAYSARGLTDGLVAIDDVPRLVRRYRRPALFELIDQGLWIPMINCYAIHDYLDWNDSRERVLTKAEAARKRRSLYEHRNTHKDAS